MRSSALLRIPTKTFALCVLASAGACKSKDASKDASHDVASAPSELSDSATGETSHGRVCDLVTRAEVEEIVGKPVEAPQAGDDGGQTKCVYSVPGGVSAVEIDVDWRGGDTGWEGVKAGKEVMDKTSSGMGMGQFNEPVSGVGDEAFVQSVKMPKLTVPGSSPVDLSGIGGGQGVLWARKGDAILSVTIANQENAKEKVTAVAKKVVSRM